MRISDKKIYLKLLDGTKKIPFPIFLIFIVVIKFIVIFFLSINCRRKNRINE